MALQQCRNSFGWKVGGEADGGTPGLTSQDKERKQAAAPPPSTRLDD